MPTVDFTNEMTAHRDTLKLLVANAAQAVQAIKIADEQAGQDKGEMIANIMLALRHMEDAAMRFGKAIQASSGGVSPLGGPDTPSGGVRNNRPKGPRGGDAVEAPEDGLVESPYAVSEVPLVTNH